jgi:hypothetical protein
LKRAEPALWHAQKCLEICEREGIGDFDIAFAFEAMARAHAIAGNVTECQRYSELAQAAGDQIADEENKEYFLGELGTVSCTAR